MMSQTNIKHTQNVTELNIHGMYVRLLFTEEPNISAPSIVRDILKGSHLQHCNG